MKAYEMHEENKLDKKKFGTGTNIFLAFVIFGFLVVVVFFWRNLGQKESSVASAASDASSDSLDNTTEIMEETQAQNIFEDLHTEKERLIAQLNTIFEEAKQNKELFALLSQDTEDESLEASFMLKDEKEKQRAKLVEQNTFLVKKKETLVTQLQEIDDLIKSFA